MSKFIELKTKKARREFITEKVMTDDRWLIKGLLTIFDHQTADEQRRDATEVHNGVGFGAFDVELMSSFSKQVIERGGRELVESKQQILATSLMSPKQVEICRRKMKKYCAQLARIADMKNPIAKKAKA